jgi:hypothetical protein
MVNQGQVKAVAKLFYDLLNDQHVDVSAITGGTNIPYPWTTDDTNYTAANLGQLKKVFSFVTNLSADADGDEMDDDWEWTHFGNYFQDYYQDPDLDGFDNYTEFLNGTDPLDYYNGDEPILVITMGDNQTGHSDSTFADPLLVDVYDSTGYFQLLNAPVEFRIVSGGGSFDPINPTVTTVRTTTHAIYGTAFVFFSSGEKRGVTSISVHALKGDSTTFSSSVSFTESTTHTPDSPDYAEVSNTATGLTLTWVDSSKDVDTFEIQKTIDGGEHWGTFTTVSGSVTSTAVDQFPNDNIGYVVIAHNEDGDSDGKVDVVFGGLDPDGDDMTNSVEFIEKTKTKTWDTDGDGIKDGADSMPLNPDIWHPRVPVGPYMILKIPNDTLDPYYERVSLMNDNRELLIYAAAQIWKNGRRVDIPTGAGGMGTMTIKGINNSGKVIGTGNASNADIAQAATWMEGQPAVTYLGSQAKAVSSGPSPTTISPSTQGLAINDNSTALGLVNAYDYYQNIPNINHRVGYKAGIKWAGLAQTGVLGEIEEDFYIPLNGEDDYIQIRPFTGQLATPIALNNGGRSVGYARDWFTPENGHSFWSPYTAPFVADTLLSALPTSTSNGEAWDINDGDQLQDGQQMIVGKERETGPTYYDHAMLWIKDKLQNSWLPKRLEDLDENIAKQSYPQSINDRMEVLGYFKRPNGKGEHTIWRNGKLVDFKKALPKGWKMLDLEALNNKGEFSATLLAQNVQGVYPDTPKKGVGIPCWLMVNSQNNGPIDGENDARLKASHKSLIVDVNNLTSSGKRRNADAVLNKDMDCNHGGYPPAKRVEPLLLHISSKGGTTASQTADANRFEVTLRIENATDQERLRRIRIFDDSAPPVAVLGATATGLQDTYHLPPEKKTASGNLQFWIEGIEADEFDISVEYKEQGFDPQKDFVHIEVNMDRKPGSEGSNNPTPLHYVQAIKQLQGVSGIKADFFSGPEKDGRASRPRLTWSNAKLRNWTSASWWIGVDDGYNSLSSWAQAGLQEEVQPDHVAGDDEKGVGCIIYGEIAANKPAFDKTKKSRYYTKVGYPRDVPKPGELWPWDHSHFEVAYHRSNPNPGASLSDYWQTSVETTAQPPSNTHPPQTSQKISLAALSGSAQGDLPFFPRPDWRTLPLNMYKASFEATASVTRLPGTPEQRASIQGIYILKNPITGGDGDWEYADFADRDLRIYITDQNGKAQLKSKKSALHYNIELENSHFVYFWDKYRWTEDGLDW